jgi:hypothetical protein
MSHSTISKASGFDANWTIEYNYFMPSTLFVFSQYFCWVRLLEEKLSFEIFEGQKEKDEFFAAIREVRTALSRWPTDYSVQNLTSRDQQIFTLQQRAIGEAMARGMEPNRKCLSYKEFLKLWNNQEYAGVLQPLRCLVEDVNVEKEAR